MWCEVQESRPARGRAGWVGCGVCAEDCGGCLRKVKSFLWANRPVLGRLDVVSAQQLRICLTEASWQGGPKHTSTDWV